MPGNEDCGHASGARRPANRARGCDHAQHGTAGIWEGFSLGLTAQKATEKTIAAGLLDSDCSAARFRQCQARLGGGGRRECRSTDEQTVE